MKKVVIIIAAQNFRDEECLEPKAVLEKAGVKVTIASRGVSQARGMLGATVAVDMDYSKINVNDFGAVVFVGGSGASVYFADAKALKLAKDFYAAGKPVAAICIAPSVLANAGILAGKNATSYPSEQRNLEAKGARYTGADVTVDGKIITASGPKAAKKFGEAIAKLL